MEILLNNLKLNQDTLNQILIQAWSYAPKLILAILTLIVGFWISKRITNSVLRVLKLNAVDPSLAKWMTSFLLISLKAVIVISVASMIGIETTSFIAVLGAAGLAIGLALQGSLANIAGGLLVLFFKPFTIGDYISAQGEEGFVENIDVFYTYLKTFDHRIIILPNGTLAGNKMINHTKLQQRRVDINIGISYKDDFKKAEQVLLELAQSEPKVLKDPAPSTYVKNHSENSVDLVFRVWCNTPDYWDVYFYINNNLKSALDKGHISIPYPQRDVHIYNH